MICAVCGHPKTRIIRSRPDPQHPARDVVRECLNPDCAAVFAATEAATRVVKTRDSRRIVRELFARIAALPAEALAELREMLKTL